jgi:Ca2+-binding RTX toxin-like protein
MRLRLALPAALIALALAPAGAGASVAYHNDSGVPTAEGGAGDDVIAARAGEGGVVFTDPAGITVRDPEREGCRQDSQTQVTCVGEGAFLLGAGGADTLRDEGLTLGFEAYGGPGDDTIAAAGVVARIFGDDRAVRPDDGNDTITGSSAEVSGNGPADDFADELNGGGGDDIIDAGAGPDHASGQAGNDTIDGGDGRDEIDTTHLLTPDDRDAFGDEGNDTLRGGAGNDQINADTGKDAVDGGDGDDFVRAVDTFLFEDDGAADTIVCGAGADRVSAGAGDRLAVGCETLQAAMQCVGGYPCKTSGTITGKKKGAKKATTVAKASETMTGPTFVAFALGSKATKLLGTRSKVSLLVDLNAKRGKKFAGFKRFSFQLTR